MRSQKSRGKNEIEKKKGHQCYHWRKKKRNSLQLRRKGGLEAGRVTNRPSTRQLGNAVREEKREGLTVNHAEEEPSIQEGKILLGELLEDRETTNSKKKRKEKRSCTRWYWKGLRPKNSFRTGGKRPLRKQGVHASEERESSPSGFIYNAGGEEVPNRKKGGGEVGKGRYVRATRKAILGSLPFRGRRGTIPYKEQRIFLVAGGEIDICRRKARSGGRHDVRRGGRELRQKKLNAPRKESFAVQSRKKDEVIREGREEETRRESHTAMGWKADLRRGEDGLPRIVTRGL